jgi:IS5 family transposase
MSAQASFLSIAHNKKLRCEKFLNQMEAVIPWGDFLDVLAPFYTEKETGRKRKELLMMLKIYFLQKWYDLSDPGMEDAIYDRCSFQKFLDIDLIGGGVPDETTILNFRHFLEEHKLQDKLFEVVQELLKRKGLIVQTGTIVDATTISASPSTKNKDRKRDPEMGSTKKGNQWFFGMKAHIGTDLHGIVHTLKCTSASVHDRVMSSFLFRDTDRVRLGDKAYGKQEEKKAARKNHIVYGIADKGSRGHPISGKQEKRNRQFSSVRSFVEHPFQVLKCQWHFRKVRYRGIEKNRLHLTVLFALCNLYRVRRQLLAPATV